MVAADAAGTITFQAVGDLALREIGVGVDGAIAIGTSGQVLVVGSEGMEVSAGDC